MWILEYEAQLPAVIRGKGLQDCPHGTKKRIYSMGVLHLPAL